MTHAALLDDATPVLFFTGKGGMGKTTLACATAVTLAQAGRRVLIVSTDPASNLDEVLQTDLDQAPRPVNDVPGLDALNIDPEAAAAAHREHAVAPYRGVLPDSAIRSMQESLSGACTVEIAAFDAFAGLLADTATTSGYDHVIFDTAPTGHTLRLLSLPGAWTDFIDTNTTGTSCLGPLAGLQTQRALYGAAVQALGDPARTTLVLVSRPERTALTEAARASSELRAAGMTNQLLLVNGILEDPDVDDLTATAFADRQAHALAEIPDLLAALARRDVPLAAHAPIGAGALACVLTTGPSHIGDAAPVLDVPERPLYALVDELERAGPGVVMTMGKGGVGKTTIASAIAVELARRGHDTLLSTTDPAAHILDTIDTPVERLEISRIDPRAVTDAYRDDVLATAGRDLDAGARAVLDEDLRSPCTEEIAVFRAFADAVAQGADRFVVLDTAPTGHTLLLLDAAEAYHRDIQRGRSIVPDAVTQLLPRLRDPGYTHVIIVALPEPTPVHEAQRLAGDLRRARIDPFAWVINQSLAATNTRDPILGARAFNEQRWIFELLAETPRSAIIAWQVNEPAGTQNLTALSA